MSGNHEIPQPVQVVWVSQQIITHEMRLAIGRLHAGVEVHITQQIGFNIPGTESFMKIILGEGEELAFIYTNEAVEAVLQMLTGRSELLRIVSQVDDKLLFHQVVDGKLVEIQA